MPGITILSESNPTLLGAPFTDEATPKILEEKMEIILSHFKKLQNLNPHVALVSLKHFFWIPKFMYLLRCCPIFNFSNTLKSKDMEMKTTLEVLFNIKLDGNGELQVSYQLIMVLVVLEFVASDMTLPAYILSVHSTSDLIKKILSTSMNDCN